MGQITRVKTENYEEWKSLRGKYIGGSDAAAVVGLNPWVSPYSLWCEKTGRTPGFEGNLATECGTYMENFVAQKFAQETGKKVRRANYSFFNSDYPFAIANIDREIVGEDAGLECKTTSELNLKKYRGGEFPENYYCQCVHYLAITGKKRWYLAVLIGNKEFRWFVIERDEAEIAALMGAERDFWRNVETDTPPEIDGLQATTDAINGIHAESNESSVDLFGYDSELSRYLDLNAQIKELESQRDEAANKIKAFMGEAGTGASERFKVSWKSGARGRFDGNRFIADHPEIDFSAYYGNPTRTFRVSKMKGA